ncbi:MAG: phosphoribosyltransferase [Deltaproteobacteria bacterium]|nr:phosphoribosyltransferase [Deltaproteobacteria bacterium]
MAKIKEIKNGYRQISYWVMLMARDKYDLDMLKNKFPKAIRLSWEDVEALVWDIFMSLVSAPYDPDVIIGVARGGLAPARILVDYLQKKYICTIQMGHWDNKKMLTERPVLIYPLPDIDLKDKRVLVVDDICDEGDTMVEVEKYLADKVGDIKIAVLVRKSDSQFIPNYCPKVMDEWRWVFFPWSKHEDLVAFVEKVLQLTGGVTIEEIIRILEYSMGVEFATPEIKRALFDMKLSGEIVEDANKGWTLI